MRIKLEYRGTTFEFERKPLPQGRFRALCALAAAGVYAGMVWAVAALCGGWGVAAIALVTLFVVMIASA